VRRLHSVDDIGLRGDAREQRLHATDGDAKVALVHGCFVGVNGEVVVGATASVVEHEHAGELMKAVQKLKFFGEGRG
jgi:hypothetical protein